MYKLTGKEFGQVPLRVGSFAGTLGEPPAQAPNRIYRAFLDRLRQPRLQSDFDASLLLTVMLHPKPEVGGVFGNKRIQIHPEKIMLDEILMANIRPIDAVNDLRRIGFDSLKTNDRFKRQFEDEKQLRSDVARSIGNQGTEGLKRIKPLLLKALLELDYAWRSPFMDKLFAIMSDCDNIQRLLPMFPPKLCQRLRFSSASEAQIAALGGALQVAGRILMEKDPAFKKAVELERTKRASAKKKP